MEEDRRRKKRGQPERIPQYKGETWMNAEASRPLQPGPPGIPVTPPSSLSFSAPLPSSPPHPTTAPRSTSPVRCKLSMTSLPGCEWSFWSIQGTALHARADGATLAPLLFLSSWPRTPWTLSFYFCQDLFVSSCMTRFCTWCHRLSETTVLRASCSRHTSLVPSIFY